MNHNHQSTAQVQLLTVNETGSNTRTFFAIAHFQVDQQTDQPTTGKLLTVDPEPRSTQ